MKKSKSILSTIDKLYTEKNNINLLIDAAKKEKNINHNLNDLYNQADIINLKLNCNKHNFRIALYHELMIGIIQVLKKYSNKTIGEKTLNKIHQELKAVTGYYIYIHKASYSYSSDYITICLNNVNDSFIYDDNIQVYLNYNVIESGNKLLIDNKLIDFNNLTIDNFNAYFCDSKYYINNIDAYINKRKKQLQVLNQEYKKMDALLKAFNNDRLFNNDYIEYDKIYRLNINNKGGKR